jgi:hypothetical protein
MRNLILLAIKAMGVANPNSVLIPNPLLSPKESGENASSSDS